MHIVFSEEVILAMVEAKALDYSVYLTQTPALRKNAHVKTRCAIPWSRSTVAEPIATTSGSMVDAEWFLSPEDLSLRNI